MIRYRIAKLIFFILCAFSISANEQRIEYGEINQVLNISYNQVRSEYFMCVFRVQIEHSSLQYTDLAIWLTLDNKEIARGQIDEKGNITLPVLDQEKAEDVLLHINQSKNDVVVSLYTDMAPITSTTVSYKALFSLLTDMNHFTDVMAGGMSWLLPSLDEIEFSFAKPATILLTDVDGEKRVFRSDNSNRIIIPFNNVWMKINPNLEFSGLPEKYKPVL